MDDSKEKWLTLINRSFINTVQSFAKFFFHKEEMDTEELERVFRHFKSCLTKLIMSYGHDRKKQIFLKSVVFPFLEKYFLWVRLINMQQFTISAEEERTDVIFDLMPPNFYRNALKILIFYSADEFTFHLAHWKKIEIPYMQTKDFSKFYICECFRGDVEFLVALYRKQQGKSIERFPVRGGLYFGPERNHG